MALIRPLREEGEKERGANHHGNFLPSFSYLEVCSSISIREWEVKIFLFRSQNAYDAALVFENEVRIEWFCSGYRRKINSFTNSLSTPILSRHQ